MEKETGRNLTDGLRDVLGTAIVGGEFAERPFPTEAELIKEHGVSRSVTREAVKMLAAKGLVGARPKRGTFVLPAESWSLFDPEVLRWLFDSQPSKALIRQFNELRIAVEPQAAALAARRATSDQIESIDKSLARMKAAQDWHDDPLDSDIAFHVAILRASNNPFFVQFREMIAMGLRTSIGFTNRLAGHPGNVAEHEDVRDAIEAKDADRAHSAMTKLLGNVLELINHG